MLPTLCLGMACALPAQQDPDRVAEAWATTAALCDHIDRVQVRSAWAWGSDFAQAASVHRADFPLYDAWHSCHRATAGPAKPPRLLELHRARQRCSGSDAAYPAYTQDVLRQEQQALTEMDDHVMQRLLRPTQCALLIVDALPAAAVALPLAEAVAALPAGGFPEPCIPHLTCLSFASPLGYP